MMPHSRIQDSQSSRSKSGKILQLPATLHATSRKGTMFAPRKHQGKLRQPNFKILEASGI
jgi:hypothetical protein